MNPKSENDKILLAILEDPDKFDIKLPSKLKKTSALLKKLKDRFGAIEKLFMEDYTGNLDESEDLLEKEEKERSKAAQLALDAINKYGVNKASDWLDELLGGRLKDAVIKIYSDKKLSRMDDDQLKKELSDLKKDNDFKRGEANAEH